LAYSLAGALGYLRSVTRTMVEPCRDLLRRFVAET
jgi:hypothetical protein